MTLVEIHESHQGTAVMRLNDPERMNALSEEMASQFKTGIFELLDRKDIKALLIIGSGSHFSSGGELQMLRDRIGKNTHLNFEFMKGFYDSFLCIRKLPFPTFAGIEGNCIGAGLCLAAACDFRLAMRSAVFSFPFLRLGLHPGMGGSVLFRPLLEPRAERALLFRGGKLSAEEALSCGLVDELIPEGQLEPQALAWISNQEGSHGSSFKALALGLRARLDQKTLEAALVKEAGTQAVNFGETEFQKKLEALLNRKK